MGSGGWEGGPRRKVINGQRALTGKVWVLTTGGDAQPHKHDAIAQDDTHTGASSESSTARDLCPRLVGAQGHVPGWATVQSGRCFRWGDMERACRVVRCHFFYCMSIFNHLNI